MHTERGSREWCKWEQHFWLTPNISFLSVLSSCTMLEGQNIKKRFKPLNKKQGCSFSSPEPHNSPLKSCTANWSTVEVTRYTNSINPLSFIGGGGGLRLIPACTGRESPRIQTAEMCVFVILQLINKDIKIWHLKSDTLRIQPDYSPACVATYFRNRTKFLSDMTCSLRWGHDAWWPASTIRLLDDSTVWFPRGCCQKRSVKSSSLQFIILLEKYLTCCG